jgi:hypothetical protein
MPESSGNRFNISIPTTDRLDAPDIPLYLRAIAFAMEGNSAMYGQGDFVDRPPSTPSTPGIEGRFYMAMDLTPRTLYYDYGTGWQSVGAVAVGSIGTASLADGAVTNIKLAADAVTSAKILDGTIVAADVADNTLTAAKLVNALVPSRGAGAGVEALRALGTAAGNAAAGIHGTQHVRGGADPTPTDPQQVFSQTGSYTPGLNHNYGIVLVNGGTITLPSDATVAFPIGSSITYVWWTAGQPLFAAGSGATAGAFPGFRISNQYAGATAFKVLANTWWVAGSLAA